MKMLPAHYEVMRTAITKYAGNNLTSIHTYYKDANVSEKQFRWDLWRNAGLLTFTCSTLYQYLNDSHIDTALRNIVKGLEL